LFHLLLVRSQLHRSTCIDQFWLRRRSVSMFLKHALEAGMEKASEGAMELMSSLRAFTLWSSTSTLIQSNLSWTQKLHQDLGAIRNRSKQYQLWNLCFDIRWFTWAEMAPLVMHLESDCNRFGHHHHISSTDVDVTNMFELIEVRKKCVKSA
jgi:hypothetical protein